GIRSVSDVELLAALRIGHSGFLYRFLPAVPGRGERNGRGIAPAALIGRSDGLQIDGLRAAGVGLDVERHLLAFRQRTHAGHFDGGRMDEHVLAAVVGRDESEALGCIKEFYCSDSHNSSFRWLRTDTCLGV